MKHQIRINVAKPNASPKKVLGAKRLCLPSRVLKMLFGEYSEILVLSPGATVQGVEVHEVRPETEVTS